MSIEIRKTTADEVCASGLSVEYEEESALKELPPAIVQMEQYKALEEAGVIYPIGAYFGTTLIGFVAVLTPIMPHYGVKIACIELFFVAKAYRKSGAGLKLLKAAERYAKESECVGLLATSPVDGDLAQVLPRVGYRNTNVVFFKNV